MTTVAPEAPTLPAYVPDPVLDAAPALDDAPVCQCTIGIFVGDVPVAMFPCRMPAVVAVLGRRTCDCTPLEAWRYACATHEAEFVEQGGMCGCCRAPVVVLTIVPVGGAR